MITVAYYSRIIFRASKLPYYNPCFTRYENVSRLVERNVYRRFYCNKPPEVQVPKPGLWQRLKVMFKDYWYVAIPVHATTSCLWFGSLYYVSRSGVDIKKYMKWMGFSESVINKVAGSGAGDLAVAYALYNVATPARYAATIGFSTYAINFLKGRGYIRTAKQISQSSKDMIARHREQYRANKTAAGAKKTHKGKGHPE